jgi:crotonyl-CoA reductase
MASKLAQAAIADAPAEELMASPVPDHYRAVYLRSADVGMFEDCAEKDVRRSLHVGAVPMPELAPNEVLIAVMASAINYNTVWSATFEPVPTFNFIDALARQGGWAARHRSSQHVIGSDAAGVVVRTGTGVRRWKVGDHVVVSAVYVDDEDPATHHDGMLGADMRAWGFETNFGALAEFAIVRASQLLSKPPHLTWEEAASYLVCASTAYRMLISPNGAQMKQGDIVLIWGAAGGLGGFAIQFVLNGGGVPIGVVSSPEKAALLADLGCDFVIDRTEIGLTGDPSDLNGFRAIGRRIRQYTGEDPHIVFEHTGGTTFGASVYVCRRGGTVITCGSSTGYRHEYDNRFLWMKLKRIVGSHAANYQEAWETNRLCRLGMIVPTLSRVFPLEHTGEAARLVQTNDHIGKIGVLCLSPREGLGVKDPELRARVGERRLNVFRQDMAGRNAHGRS